MSLRLLSTGRRFRPPHAVRPPVRTGKGVLEVRLRWCPCMAWPMVLLMVIGTLAVLAVPMCLFWILA